MTSPPSPPPARPFHRLLIANRGEIARRVIRTAHAMGLETVAVFSDADDRALHTREATLACALGGTASADSYLRIDALLAAARATGADAVHPGYGFLSENADFAQAVADAGLVWVGPPASVIRALGSKSGAKAMAQALGVPCLPGYFGTDQSDDRFAVEADRIGYPVMVKAVAGGGGRGMRLVTGREQLAAALRSARSEALAGFGSAELLLERALLAPRHVEVQVFADAWGDCIHLGERDCSVQRRHQKIIEETPSPAVGPELRERMGQCAVALAAGAGYVGAGTVEFLLQGDEFFLMEVNTRLQVEHPVTEAVTGLDLVAWQIRVARGEPLPLKQSEVRFQGHAIEVRLCAEDEHFTPHTGTVQRFVAPRQVRCDHALYDGAEVTPHYDAMLGKLIAHADDRSAAIAQLDRALEDTTVLGLSTNRAFLRACLRHPGFAQGQALIPFLAEQGDALRARLAEDERHALWAASAVAVFASGGASALTARLALPFPRPVRVRHRGDVHAFALQETGGGEVVVSGPGHRQVLHLAPASPGDPAHHTGAPAVQAWGVTCDGVRRRVSAVATPSGRWHVQVGGVDLWLDDLTLQSVTQGGAGAGASEVRAPFNGKVIAVPLQAGTAVAQGDTVMVIESMKLEHAITAPRAGRLAAIAVAVGQQVVPGQLLWNLEA